MPLGFNLVVVAVVVIALAEPFQLQLARSAWMDGYANQPVRRRI